MEVSKENGRKIVLVGRSVERNVEIAIRLGYLKSAPNLFVNFRKSKNFDQNKLTYIVAGSYGQSNSSLYRIAHHSHKFVKLDPGATVVFSADPSPPSVLVAFNHLLDTLTESGAKVIYTETQEMLHVSGHGLSGDMSLLAGIVNPKYFIPIGGTPIFMRAYRELMAGMGFKRENVFELLDGESVVFDKGKAKLGKKEHSGNVYLGPSRKNDIEDIVLRDRKVLADDGIVVAIIPIDKKGKFVLGSAEIVTRGFVYVKESKDLIRKAKKQVAKVVKGKKVKDGGLLKREVEKKLSHYLRKETGMRPLVLAMIIEI